MVIINSQKHTASHEETIYSVFVWEDGDMVVQTNLMQKSREKSTRICRCMKHEYILWEAKTS